MKLSLHYTLNLVYTPALADVLKKLIFAKAPHNLTTTRFIIVWYFFSSRSSTLSVMCALTCYQLCYYYSAHGSHKYFSLFYDGHTW